MMKTYLILHTIALATGCIADLAIGDPHGIPHPIVWIGRLISALEEMFIGGSKNLTGSKETDSNEQIGKGMPESNVILPIVSNPSSAEQDYSQEKSGIQEENENHTNKTEGRKHREFIYGSLLCVIVVSLTALLSALILVTTYYIHPALGVVVEAILTCYILAAGSLYDESMKVFNALTGCDRSSHSGSDTNSNPVTNSHTDSILNTETDSRLSRARQALSMIVGRDTNRLDEAGIIKACVETVAENTSDGVIAPLFYTAIGGPVLGLIYKSINTMDSMVGYRNERYEYFGRAAAKLDDAVNYIPSRLSALLIIMAAYIAGICFNGSHAYRIWHRDRRNHLSPNSAQTESACAGALGIRLGGGSFYGGVYVNKPYIGDDSRPVEPDDIKRANVLMYASEAILLLIILCLIAVAVVSL